MGNRMIKHSSTSSHFNQRNITICVILLNMIKGIIMHICEISFLI